jgi:hypothetical protein
MPPNTYPARVGEIRFKLESTAAAPIATPPSFWSTSPKQMRAWDVKPGNTREAEDDPSLVQHAMEDRQRLLLGKKSALQWTSWLTGLSTSTPAQDALGLFLKGALGGESLGPASTTVDPANTGAGATAPLLVIAGAGFTVGQAVKVVSTRTELRRIVARVGNNITLDQDLAAVPTSGAVLGSATYYPDPAALSDLNNTGHLTFAALFRGANPAEQVQHRGCFFGVELADLGQNKRPKVQCSANGLDWDYVNGIASLPTFVEAASPNQVNSGLYIAAQGSSAANVIHTADIDIKLGLSVDPQMSPVGKNGVIGHLAFGGRTSLEFTTFFAVADWFDQFEAGTKFYAGYQLGNHALITFPQLSIDEAPEASGAGAQPRSVKVKLHADNGPTTTNDLTLARFAIHRFGGP